MKLLLLADFHLGADFAAWGPRAGAAREACGLAWHEAMDLALDPAAVVDGLLVAGDLFDAPEPRGEILETVRRDLERLVRAGKTVVLLPGIYDGLASPRSVYERKPWPAEVYAIDWTRPRLVSLAAGGEPFRLVTFAPLPTTAGADMPWPQVEARGDTGPRIGLFHAVTDMDSPLATWGSRIVPEALVGLDLDLLVLGGDHGGRDALWGKTRVLGPGSPAPLHPRDSAAGAWTLVTLTEAGVTVEQRPRKHLMETGAEPGNPSGGTAARFHEATPGGLRAALLRVYEERLRGGDDPVLLEAALRYGLEKLDRSEACHVD